MPKPDMALPVFEKDQDSNVVAPVLSMDIVSDANVAMTASFADTDKNANICKKCKSSSHVARNCSGSSLKQIPVQVSNNSVKPKQSTKNN